MKAGKINVEHINFLGYTVLAIDHQRLREIEDELEYELSADYSEEDDEENEDEEEKYLDEGDD